MSDDIAISVKNLSKTYRIFGHPGDRIKQALTLGRVRFHKEFTALDNISFDIKKGETVGIIGRNGSGKSTLLQIICGILKPTSGSVVVNGRISALLELGAGFNPEFTGRENVYFQGALMGFTKAQMDERFDDIAAFADIGEFIDQPVRTYSSGMFVRLAFAAMIHANADVLIIDEALAVGDEAFQKKCFDRLANYLDGMDKVLFLVSHNLRQIERVCSRVIWVDGGSIVEQGPASIVCNSYQTNIYKNIHKNNDIGVNEQSFVNSGEVEVLGVSLWQGKDEQVTEIQMHTSVKIVVEFNCHAPLDSPEILVGFHTTDAVLIAATTTASLSEAMFFPVGRHAIVCYVKDMIFLPGVYQIRLAFIDKYRRFMWVGHKLSTFRVTPSQDLNLMRVPVGLIDMPFEWALSEPQES